MCIRDRLQVSQNFFPLLGVQPILGTQFSYEDCQFRWNSPKVALLSYSLWQTLFHGERAIVGRQITLNDTPVRVIGVLPRSFSFDSVFAPGNRIDIYLPYPLTEQASRRGNELAMIGRLKPGATLASARAEMSVLGPRIRRMDPDRNFQLLLSPLAEHVSGHLRTALLVLVCAVGVVMLIACANPVSYTHLDVYKRQVFRCGACFSLPRRVKLACRHENGFNANSTISGIRNLDPAD